MISKKTDRVPSYGKLRDSTKKCQYNHLKAGVRVQEKKKPAAPADVSILPVVDYDASSKVLSIYIYFEKTAPVA